MKVSSELMKNLNEHVGWNKVRMGCFSQMLLWLIGVRPVNLQEIALEGEAQVSSRYRRFQQFFAIFDRDAVAGEGAGI